MIKCLTALNNTPMYFIPLGNGEFEDQASLSSDQGLGGQCYSFFLNSPFSMPWIAAQLVSEILLFPFWNKLTEAEQSGVFRGVRRGRGMERRWLKGNSFRYSTSYLSDVTLMLSIRLEGRSFGLLDILSLQNGFAEMQDSRVGKHRACCLPRTH